MISHRRVNLHEIVWSFSVSGYSTKFSVLFEVCWCYNSLNLSHDLGKCLFWRCTNKIEGYLH